jgi:hypothetical protein
MDAPTLATLSLPDDVKRALMQLRDDLKTAASTNLASLMVYGGLVRGRYVVGRSDINVVVVLRDSSLPSLNAIAPILHSAWRSHRVEPFLLPVNEMQNSANVFPSKFLDIKKHNIVLYGENPFEQVTVSHEQLHLRVEQELRNMVMRLRRRYLQIVQSPAEQAQLLADIARPFALNLALLLSLDGKDVPADNKTESILLSAAHAFNLDAKPLAQLAALRERVEASSNVSELFAQVLNILEKVLRLVEQQRDRR